MIPKIFSRRKFIFLNPFSGEILFSSLVCFAFVIFLVVCLFVFLLFFFLVCLFFEIKYIYSDTQSGMRAGE